MLLDSLRIALVAICLCAGPAHAGLQLQPLGQVSPALVTEANHGSTLAATPELGHTVPTPVPLHAEVTVQAVAPAAVEPVAIVPMRPEPRTASREVPADTGVLHARLTESFSTELRPESATGEVTMAATPVLSSASEPSQSGQAPDSEPATTTATKWLVPAKGTLRELIESWGAKAGWLVVWNTTIDYRLKAEFEVEGDFLTAADAVFLAYRSAKTKFDVTSHPNRVLIVETREAK